MTSTITFTPASTISVRERVQMTPVVSNAQLVGSRRIAPTFVSADEAYYWSFPWQADVQASMAALAEGDYEDFDSDDPSDVVRWMLSVDDDA
jgi:hypothetical protein